MMLEVVAVAVYLDLDTLKLCIDKTHNYSFHCEYSIIHYYGSSPVSGYSFFNFRGFFLSLEHAHVPCDTSNDVNA